MNIGILIVTHGDIGKEIYRAASMVLGGKCPLKTEIISVGYDYDIDVMRKKAVSAVEKLGCDRGVLVLTDIYGGTPSNIAESVCDPQHSKLIAGLNLPMLLRVMNYPELPLIELAQKACSGGRDGIYQCEIHTISKQA